MAEPKIKLNKPQPLGSLMASAKRLTTQSLTRRGLAASSWQEDAWEMFDLVGEHRFLVSTLGGRLSRARLYIGSVGNTITDEPTPVDNPLVNDVLDAIGDSAAARQQLLQRLAVNLQVAGDGYLVGIPDQLLPESMRSDASIDVAELDGYLPPLSPASMIDITGLSWRMLSISEVTSNAGGQLTLRLGEATSEHVLCSPEDIFLIRIWQPHPRRWWEADSPTRSSLSVLRELVGLTMHISAQVDSRLAGAGLLIVPQSAQRALSIAAGLDEADQIDQFTEALMEAMIKPITDRSSASALVPLVVTVPDAAVNLFNFITFAKPLDTEARNLREEAIRRLALGMDCPPELLLGTGGMNHWGAWLVQEDTVTTHLEPTLALICDALTTQYLWPVLIDRGMDEAAAHNLVIWYDVADLIVRPNHSADAILLHERGIISDAALRDATGFDESQAPIHDAMAPEVSMALEMVRLHPNLLYLPGLPAIVEQFRVVLENSLVPGIADSTYLPPPSKGGPAPLPPGALPSANPVIPPGMVGSVNGHK